MSSDNNTSLKQDGFNSQIGFIIACVGSAVGMGNLWRFPVLVSAWGGMTFLIPYFIFVILIGSTGVVEEIALGRSTGKGPIGAFGAAMAYAGKSRKVGEGIGIIPTIGSLAVAIGYTCVVGWIFKYVVLAFTGQLFEDYWRYFWIYSRCIWKQYLDNNSTYCKLCYYGIWCCRRYRKGK